MDAKHSVPEAYCLPGAIDGNCLGFYNIPYPASGTPRIKFTTPDKLTFDAAGCDHPEFDSEGQEGSYVSPDVQEKKH